MLRCVCGVSFLRSDLPQVCCCCCCFSLSQYTIYRTLTILLDFLLAKCQQEQSARHSTPVPIKKNMKEINMIDAKQPAHTKQIHSHTQKESVLVANASFFHCDREKSISRLIDVGNVNDISFAFTLRKWLIVRHIDVTFLLAVSIAILRDQIKYSVREKTNRNSLRI